MDTGQLMRLITESGDKLRQRQSGSKRLEIAGQIRSLDMCPREIDASEICIVKRRIGKILSREIDSGNIVIIKYDSSQVVSLITGGAAKLDYGKIGTREICAAYNGAVKLAPSIIAPRNDAPVKF